MDIKTSYPDNPDVTISTSKKIKDTCVIECIENHNENNLNTLILIDIYISSKIAMTDINILITKSVLPLFTSGSQALADFTGKEIDYCEPPVACDPCTRFYCNFLVTRSWDYINLP